MDKPTRRPRKLFDWKGEVRYSWKADWPIEYPEPRDEAPLYQNYI